MHARITEVMNSSPNFKKYTNLLLHQDIVDTLQTQYPSYDVVDDIRIVVSLFLQGLTDFPQCANIACDKPVSFYKGNFGKTCSQQCNGIYKMAMDQWGQVDKKANEFLISCEEIPMTDAIRSDILDVFNSYSGSNRYDNILKDETFLASLKNEYPTFDIVKDIKSIMILFSENMKDYPVCALPSCNNKTSVVNRKVSTYCTSKCAKIHMVETGDIVENRQKAKQTYKNRTGYDSPFVNPDAIAKKNVTVFERYGVINAAQSQEVKDRTEQTMKERYGGFTMSSEILRERTETTNLVRYGHKNPFANDEIKKKIKHIIDNRTPEEWAVIRENYTKTMQQRYNVDHYSQTDEFIVKTTATSMERYGVSHPSKTKEVVQKIAATTFKNHGVYSFMCKHIDARSIEIIRDTDELEKMLISTPSIRMVANELGVHPKTVTTWKNTHAIDIDFSIRSSYELELSRILVANEINFISNNRTVLGGKELDFYLPDHNLAIEINGVYWHSHAKKGTSFHIDKWRTCEELGITLYTIYEDEWLTKRDMWISRILHFCGKSQYERVHARKCKVAKVVKKTTVYDFLNDNHIQGTTQFSVAYGLFHEEKLVSVMTFSNTRNNSSSSIELSRFCSLSGFQVVGAASRLLAAFIKENSKFASIVSFSDNQYSNGNVYRELGFEYDGHLKTDYKYVINGKRVHKSNYRKSAIKKKFGLSDEMINSHTEFELMDMLNIDRIYDCGKKKWRYDIVPVQRK